MNIKESIENLIKDYSSDIVLAKIVSIDYDKKTCVVSLGSVEYVDVRLNSIVKTELPGLTVFPKIGSMVLINQIANSSEMYVVNTSEIDRFSLKIEDFCLDVSEDGFTFNQAKLGSYASDINKLVEKINKLETEINDLKGVFKNWAPAPQDGGAQLKTAVASWTAKSIETTTVDDIKDETIKH
ncbi:MAG: hypothetical protein N4A49_06740 [Marinifilaceae bacterium]|jgi:hypothetical protein|nr:hypothetical protein [Marinifilaceae bacterium]